MADEVARFVSPVISFVRTATSDTELHGQPIAQGDKLLLLYQSANRDEDVFDRPDEFDVTRSPNPQIAFGVGPHVCMGINLARLEIRVLFEELIRRFPDMHLAPGFTPTYVEHALVHAIETLPVSSLPSAPKAGDSAAWRSTVRVGRHGHLPRRQRRSSAATSASVASSSCSQSAPRADDHAVEGANVVPVAGAAPSAHSDVRSGPSMASTIWSTVICFAGRARVKPTGGARP